MNITAINSYTPKPNVTPVSFQEVISPVSYPEKKKMSDSTKAMIGLGALGTVAAGTLLVKRHCDTKAANEIKELAQKMLKKPEKFDLNSIKDIIGGFTKDGILEKGDSLVFMPVNMLDELVAKSPSSKWSKIVKAMGFSENAFTVVVRKSDKKILNDTMRYFQPKEILYKDMNDAFKNGEIFVTNIV